VFLENQLVTCFAHASTQIDVVQDRFGVLAGMLPKPIIAPARTILLLLIHPRLGSGQKGRR
jgi:hypothetical protein